MRFVRWETGCSTCGAKVYRRTHWGVTWWQRKHVLSCTGWPAYPARPDVKVHRADEIFRYGEEES
jgi:hypothetical protein